MKSYEFQIYRDRGDGVLEHVRRVEYAGENRRDAEDRARTYCGPNEVPVWFGRRGLSEGLESPAPLMKPER